MHFFTKDGRELLPSHIPALRGLGADIFLLEQLRWTIVSNVVGGDTCEDNPEMPELKKKKLAQSEIRSDPVEEL